MTEPTALPRLRRVRWMRGRTISDGLDVAQVDDRRAAAGSARAARAGRARPRARTGSGGRPASLLRLRVADADERRAEPREARALVVDARPEGEDVEVVQRVQRVGALPRAGRGCSRPRRSRTSRPCATRGRGRRGRRRAPPRRRGRAPASTSRPPGSGSGWRRRRPRRPPRRGTTRSPAGGRRCELVALRPRRCAYGRRSPTGPELSQSARPRNRLRNGFPGRNPSRLLGPGLTAAPGRNSLALLPSGPDAVRRLPVRGTRPSTLRAWAQAPKNPPLGRYSASLERIASAGNR